MIIMQVLWPNLKFSLPHWTSLSCPAQSFMWTSHVRSGYHNHKEPEIENVTIEFKFENVYIYVDGLIPTVETAKATMALGRARTGNLEKSPIVNERIFIFLHWLPKSLFMLPPGRFLLLALGLVMVKMPSIWIILTTRKIVLCEL